MSDAQTAPAFDPVDGGVTAPLGFSAAGVAAGIKKSGRLDVALLSADHAVPASAVYTTNACLLYTSDAADE